MEEISITEIKKTIRQIMDELVEFDAAEIDENSLFVEELGVNSITIVQIFLSCQDKYDIVLANEMNLAEPMSIRSLAEMVYAKINEANK